MNTPRTILSLQPAAEKIAVGSVIEIEGTEFNHLTRSMRLKLGAQVEILFRPTNEAYLAKLISISKTSAQVELLREQFLPSLPRVHLLCASVDEPVCDQIVDQCVQAGACSISFFYAERSQRAPKAERLVRWERIAATALKQSGFHHFNGIQIFSSLEAGLDELHLASAVATKRLLLAPDVDSDKKLHGSNTLQQLLGGIASSPVDRSQERSISESPLQHIQQNAESYLIVGPEGGLTENEIKAANRFSYEPVSLGIKTFRTEAAALLGTTLCVAFGAY